MLLIRTFQENFGPFRIISNILEHLGTFWNILEHFETFWNILEHFGTFWYICSKTSQVRKLES
jgi:hypothetical protein